MPFANPALNERVFSKEMDDGSQSGWAAPGGPATGTATVTDAGVAAPPAPQPIQRSAVPPFETTTGRVMTAGGTFTATLVLFVLLLAGAWVGWQQVHVTATTATTVSGTTQTVYNIHIPSWIWIAMLGAFGLAMVTIFKPKLARFTTPDLRRRRGRRPRGHLGRVQPAVQRHRATGGAGHAVGVRGDAVPLHEPHHQGHRAVPPHRHLLDARHRGALRRLDHRLAVRRQRAVPRPAVVARHRPLGRDRHRRLDEPDAQLRLHRARRRAPGRPSTWSGTAPSA